MCAVIGNTAASSDRSVRVIIAIVKLLDERWPLDSHEAAPLYPDSVPQLAEHVADLIAIAGTSEQCVGQAHCMLRAQVCAKCPYHQSIDGCPLRRTKSCALSELAEPIMQTVRAAIAPAAATGSSPDVWRAHPTQS